MARNEQLVRQLRILQILEQSRLGRTLAELSGELVEQLGLTKLSQRTVRRDLEALQAAGFDVDSHASARGTAWKIGPALRGTPSISASTTELLALSIGRDLLLPLVGTPYWQGIESLCNKIQEVLPEPVSKHFDKHRRHILVRGAPAKSYVRHEGILATLNRAISQHRTVEIEYQSLGRDQAESRRIEPYALVVYQGSIYVVAAACESAPQDAMRHWKLDRFRKAVALDQRFKPSKNFDPHEHFAHSLGIFKSGAPAEFRIRLTAYATPLVSEDPWHPQQRLEPLSRGGAILSIPSAYEREILPRVLALGAEAEILSPAASRQALVQTVRQLAELYGTE